jgi:uncharacterized protein (DUF1330 family)
MRGKWTRYRKGYVPRIQCPLWVNNRHREFIVRGGRTFVVNGAPPKRIAVIRWDSYEKAQAFFDSETYRQLISLRDKSSNFRAFVIEGALN